MRLLTNPALWYMPSGRLGATDIVIEFNSNPLIELDNLRADGFPMIRGFDLVLPDFLLLGVYPIRNIKVTESTQEWLCRLDHFEHIESHNMHYRHKDIPNLWDIRQAFIDVPTFVKLLDQSPGKHFIVDRLTVELLNADFDVLDQGRHVRDLLSRDSSIRMASAEQRARTGLLFRYVGLLRNYSEAPLVFTDAYLPPDRQWVNESNSDSARPQFLVVAGNLIKPYGA